MPDRTPSIPKYSSVKTLLNGLFDYAGLFPPASLPLEEAIREYMDHRSDPDAWMMGPFVVPVSRLDEVVSLSALFTTESPVSFDVLPRRAPSTAEFHESLREDLSTCAQFETQMQGKASVDALEFSFPSDALLDGKTAVRSIHQVRSILEGAERGPLAVFAEISRSENYLQQLPLYFLGLASQSTENQPIFGKIRCGGMSKSDFPTPFELASFIHTAVRVNHPFKATAGLHHPLRHFNETQGVTMHGFLNVFFATTLAAVHDLNPARIQTILEDERSESFRFTPSGICWNELEASTTSFLKARSSLGLSIGSCSFTEPREDLHHLGWLTQ